MKDDLLVFAQMVRDRVSAQDVAQDFGLQLRRDGRCRCIFCDGDRADTLRIYPGARGYYCFRCHEHGDVIMLYRKLTGAGFRQAIEDLNEQYGLGLPLSGADREAMEKAKREAEKRKREREEKAARDRQLFEDYLDIADAVQMLEGFRKNLAPDSPDQPITRRFYIALKYLDQMREARDAIFDELYGKF